MTNHRIHLWQVGMFISPRVFLILLVPLLLHGAPTPGPPSGNPPANFEWSPSFAASGGRRLPVPAPQVQGSPHWQVTGSHGTPNVNAPPGQFEWSPSFAGGRIMPPVPVPQAQGSHTPNVHAAPLGAGTSSPPQGPHVTNSASQTVDANRPPSEPAHDHRQVAHKNPAHVTNPGQTVDANRPASEPALPDYKLPPTKADKFVDLTKVHIDIRLPKSACVLPPKSWYRVRSSMEPKYFSTVSPNRPTAIRQYSIAVPAELGLLVLIPPDSIVEISKFPSDIRVPADSGIRVIDVPDSDKKMIWEKCLESYKEQFKAIRREFPDKKIHARIRFMQKCFDSNLWEFGREQEPDGSVKFNFVFLELKIKQAGSTVHNHGTSLLRGLDGS